MEFYILAAVIFALVLLEIFVIVHKRKKRLPERDIKLVTSEWGLIEKKVDREPKHALMEADRVLDFVLKKKGYEGSLGEKLKQAEKLFKEVDRVWEAHKLRNQAVHEIGFNLESGQARKALSSFKQALWDLGIKL